MGMILLPCDRQPPGTVRAATDGLARGLIYLSEPFNRVSFDYRNLANAGHAGLTNEYTPALYGLQQNAAARWGSLRGYKAEFNNTQLVLPSTISTRFGETGQATVACIVQANAGNNSYGPVRVNGASPASPDFYPYDPDGKIYIGPFSNVRWVNAITPNTSIYEPHMWSASHKSGEQAFYMNGSLLTTASNVETPALNTDGHVNETGWTYWLAVWDRYLSPGEHALLAQNPWQLYEPRRLFFSAAGGGAGQTIAVPAGALTLTGFAPTVVATANVRISVPSGALTLTGFAPTVLNPRLVSVPAGALTLTGFAPTISAPATLAIPAGSLTLTGYAPTIVTGGNRTIDVPAGALSLTGFAPTVVNPRNVAVPAGALTLTGFAPTVRFGANIAVPAGALTLTGLAPTVATTAHVTVQVPAGSLTLTGYAPTVLGGQVVAPRQTGAGRPKRRERSRQLVVEINGEDRFVDSVDEARALLQQVREEAEQKANLALERATKAQRRPARKVLQDARRLLVVPDVEVEGSPELQQIAANMSEDIRGLYESTLQAIEIGALMRRRQMEDDDDEDVILLSL